MADLGAKVLILGITNLTDDEHPAFTSSYACGGKTFEILVTDDPPPGYDRDGAEVSWIDQLIELSMHDDTDRDKSLAQMTYSFNLASDIKAIALPTLVELASLTPSSPSPKNPRQGPLTVQEDLYPNVVKLQLVSRASRFELIQGHHTSRGLMNEPVPITHRDLQQLGVGDITSLPTSPDTDVVLLSRFQHGGNAYDAVISGDDQNFVCKLALNWYRGTFLRELGMLAKVTLAMMARVSVLQGLVTHGDGIVGMLIQKIPARFPNLYQHVSTEDHVPPALRQKWVAQIESTVEELHKNGIIWGDVKPDNIIIDVHDDAWLIDFGGGYNPHWVDASVAESVEGDLQGVERIRSMLEKE